MNILVACEESQKVCVQFRLKGHNAFSCDIQECSGGHPEWHIHGDVLPLLNGNCYFETMNGDRHSIEGKWDMIIAFPPCTHLALSGAQHFDKKREDGRQRDAIEFFCKMLTADCEHIAVENPRNIMSGGNYLKTYFPELCEKYRVPKRESCVIQPWMFGDVAQKTTCLWLKNIPNLVADVTTKPDMEFYEWINKKTGKVHRQSKWSADIFFNSRTNPEQRQRQRSATFDGIARTMVNCCLK